MRRIVSVVSLFAVVSLLAACGQSLSPEEVIAAVPGAVESREAVESVTTITTGALSTMTVSGVESMDSMFADMVLVISAAGEEVEMSVRVVDGVFFYENPQLAGWVSMTPEEMRATTGHDPSAAPSVGQATEVLGKFSDAASEVTELGPGRHNGVEVTRYRFKVPFADLADDAVQQGMTDPRVAKAAKDMYPEFVEMELWVDADNLPRKLSWSADVDMSSLGAGQEKVSFEAEYLDWDATVSVTAPPAGEVTSVSELLGGQ